jgi:hypothetical protein
MNDRDFEQGMPENARRMRCEVKGVMPSDGVTYMWVWHNGKSEYLPAPVRTMRMECRTLPWGQVIRTLVEADTSHSLQDYFR